jgi:hypothetical protein
MTRNTFAFAYGISAVLALVGAGCKSDEPSPTIASFCTQKADRECGTANKGMAANCGADLATCKVTRTANCVNWASPQLTASRPIRPENIGNCLDKTSDAYAGTIVTPDKIAIMNDACSRVFSGNIPANSLLACHSDYECAANLICDQANCVKKTAPGVNGFCSDPGTVCPANQYCAPVGAFKKCAPSKQGGEVCDAATPCVDAFRCGSAGICVAKATINTPCSSNVDCAVEAPYCDPYYPTGCSCRPGFTPSPTSPECASFGNTLVTGAPAVCGGNPGGAAGAPGTAGASGAAGNAGSAGAAGTVGAAGAPGGVGGAGGAG